MATKKEIRYAEPEGYFPKEIRNKFFAQNKNKGKKKPAKKG